MNITQAAPVEYTVVVKAQCAHCAGDITRTMDGNRVFAWFHADTGSEGC